MLSLASWPLGHTSGLLLMPALRESRALQQFLCCFLLPQHGTGGDIMQKIRFFNAHYILAPVFNMFKVLGMAPYVAVPT